MTSKTQTTGKWTTFAGACVLGLCATASTALGGSVTQPGETVGLAVGAPLPPGLYFVNTADYGIRSDVDVALGVDIPVIAWSTPWTILNARLQFLVATPLIEAGVHHANYIRGFYNPFVAGQLAWDLGNGFGFSYAIGAYFDVSTEVAWSSTSLNQRFALSYTANGWDLTANAIWGIQGNSVTSRPQISACPPPFATSGCNPDFINVDLTATKKFGKWEVGPIGYFSSDLSTPVAGYAEQSQFALGGLVGYDFGPITLQAYASHDVYQKNYGGYDTRVWGRVIIPIWTQPAAPVAPRLITKG